MIGGMNPSIIDSAVNWVGEKGYNLGNKAIDYVKQNWGKPSQAETILKGFNEGKAIPDINKDIRQGLNPSMPQPQQAPVQQAVPTQSSDDYDDHIKEAVEELSLFPESDDWASKPHRDKVYYITVNEGGEDREIATRNENVYKSFMKSKSPKIKKIEQESYDDQTIARINKANQESSKEAFSGKAKYPNLKHTMATYHALGIQVRPASDEQIDYATKRISGANELYQESLNEKDKVKKKALTDEVRKKYGTQIEQFLLDRRLTMGLAGESSDSALPTE